MRPSVILLVHHSHTDLGYTERQGRVERLHAGFIRRAAAICRRRQGFRWQCEGHWGLERFWDVAEAAEQAEFVDLVREGRIGLSGSYLNFSELVGDRLFRVLALRAAGFASERGLPLDAAMTADVNGHGPGMAAAWLDAGVENLFACVHTHHGRYPLERPPEAFWWEQPDGRRLLTLSGEHYHFGNELGLAPAACSSYLTKDECDAEMIFHRPREVAALRIPRWIEALDAQGWPFECVPVMVSGLRTDNGPPSEAVIDQVEWWNAAHGDTVRIEMATLSQVFARLREGPVDALPVHSGDWPDWWSDGPAGDPDAVRLFRDAQRTADLLADLHAADPAGDPPVPGDLDDTLARFAEHTFGHDQSVSQPWRLEAVSIAQRKRADAALAADRAHALLDAAAERRGAADPRPGLPARWRVENPHRVRLRDAARLSIGHHEYRELGLDAGVRALRESDGATLPLEVAPVPRGAEYRVPVDLAPGEGFVLRLVPDPDGVRLLDGPAPERAVRLDTDHVALAWRPGRGITEWRTADGRDLLRPDRDHPPLTLLREVTPVPSRDDVCAVRGAMGLDRKGAGFRRDAANLLHARTAADGAVLAGAVLAYELAGTRLCEIELTSHRHAPRIDAELRLHKESRWEPENLLLTLPFGVGDLWIDKAGSRLRPRRDQIPGTLTDFYALQAGFARTGEGFGTAVATPDSHLLQLGDLEPGERLLAGDPRLAEDPAHARAWLMTNYWETNFAAELGGFHGFRFCFAWGDDLADPDAALDACTALTLEPWCLRLEDG